jgi:hypothetical protein
MDKNKLNLKFVIMAFHDSTYESEVIVLNTQDPIIRLLNLKLQSQRCDRKGHFDS